MRKLALFSVLALLAFTAIDFPALPDGGSMVTPSQTINSLPDGGTSDGGWPAFVTVDTGQTQDWIMTIRCRTSADECIFPSPRVYYRLSTDAGTASSAYQLLEVDRTFDLPVIQGNTDKFRWLSLRGEDGGPPCCNVQTHTAP